MTVLKLPSLIDRYGYDGNSFIVDKLDAKGKGTLFSSFRENINTLIYTRNKRRDNIVDNLSKAISKAYDTYNKDKKSTEIDPLNDIDDLYLHTYVINGGYDLAIIVLSDYLMDKAQSKEYNMCKYEGVDELLFPFLFICTHAIEISMKAFIWAHGCRYTKVHKIKELLKTCNKVSFDDDVKNVLNSYSDFIEELDNVVQNGFAMRYPVDSKGNNFLKFTYVINIEVLRDITLHFTTFMSRFAYGYFKYF